MKASVSSPRHDLAAAESNLAHEAKVTVSSQLAAYEGSKAADRIWGQTGPDGGEWASEETNPWIRLDWADRKTVSRVLIYDRATPDAHANAGVLTFSDGSTAEVSGLPADGSAKEVTLSPKRAVTWVKFQVTGGQGQHVGLAEIKVLGTPVRPYEYPVSEAEICALLERLDLDYPGLERVKKDYHAKRYQEAAQGLLDYFRFDAKRRAIYFPPNRADKQSTLGSPLDPAGEKQLRKVFAQWRIGREDDPKKYTYLGERIDWYRNLNGDESFVGDLNFLYQFSSLLSDYWRSGDEEYVQEFIEEFLDWYVKCPVLRDANNHYSYEGGTNWDTFRAIQRLYVLTGCFQYAIDSPLITKGVLVKLLNCIFDHADYMRHYDGSHGMPVDPDHYSQGNFGIYEASSVASAAVLFPEFRDARAAMTSEPAPRRGWRTSAANLLRERMRPYPEGDFYRDGMYWEECIVYAQNMIQTSASIPYLFERNGYRDDFPQAYKDRVADSLGVLMKMLLPDGSPSRFGDDGAWNGGGFEASCYPLLSYDGSYDRPDYRYVFSGGKEGSPPAETAYALPDSGYYSMRSGWDREAVCLVLKCGPAGEFQKWPVEFHPYDLRNEACTHIQRDNGTFELYAGGRNLTPDSGSYTYDCDDASRRWWYRQTRVHQTLTLDNASSLFAPKLILWQPGADLDALIVENGSYENLLHRRAVLFVKKQYLVIVDEGIGTAEGSVDVHFQFAPGGIVRPDKLSARTDFSTGWNLLVQGLETGESSFVEEEGWVSLAYDHEQPRPAFAFRSQKRSGQNVRFVTLVIPYQGSTAPKASVRLVGAPEPGTGTVEMEVTVNGEAVRLGYAIEKKEAWLAAR